MSRATVRYCVRLAGAGAIHPGSGSGGIVDRRVTREAGRPLVPGSHVRGVVRWQLERICRGLGIEAADPFDADATGTGQSASADRGGDDPVARLFGAGTDDELTVFTDLRESAEPPGSTEDTVVSARARVAIDRRRGTQAPGRLYDLETWEPRRELSGECRVFAPDAKECENRTGWLIVGLRAVTGFGGSRSSGLGRCAIEVCSVEIDGQSRDWQDLVRNAVAGREDAR
ncbi:MAG: hypothetical protein D6738_14665 [Acidobacteria bacterium]|nr:MAG: hypothetical protein D6738_14665 [Acidobacteriota bacterium]